MARHPRHRRGDRHPSRGRLHRSPRHRRAVARRRGPPSPPRPPRRRQRRRADPVGHVRQRTPDARRHHQRVPRPLLHRGPASAGPAPRRTRHGSRPCSATSKPSGPTSRRSPTPTRCEQSSTSPDTTTTPAACTPPSATSPPTTNTKAEQSASARPAKTASTGPASPASPTIATTNPTSHEHTRPMRRNQTPENGHLLRSTSAGRSCGRSLAGCSMARRARRGCRLR